MGRRWRPRSGPTWSLATCQAQGGHRDGMTEAQGAGATALGPAVSDDADEGAAGRASATAVGASGRCQLTDNLPSVPEEAFLFREAIEEGRGGEVDPRPVILVLKKIFFFLRGFFFLLAISLGRMVGFPHQKYKQISP